MSSSVLSLSRASRSVRGVLPSSLITVRSFSLLSKSGIASASLALASPAASSLLSCRHFSFYHPLKAADGFATKEAEQDAHDSIEDDTHSFQNYADKIHPSLYKALTVAPFQLKKPSPVQSAVFDLLPSISDLYNPENPSKESRDLLVKAKTGTGKTLAFLVPAVENRLNAIEKVGQSAASPQERRKLVNDYVRGTVGTLVISPTRELATQIATEAQKLCEHTDLEVRLFTGGSSKGLQASAFHRGRRDIVVATPGRLFDFLSTERGVADSFKDLNVLVLDEADTLLNMGFRQEIETILKYLPKAPQRQTFFFSATMPKAVIEIAKAALEPKHKFIDIVPSKDTSPVHAHIPQYYTALDNAAHQLPHLLRLLAHDQLDNPGKSKVIIFFQTTKMTQLFSTLLQELKETTLPAGRGTRFYEIHGKKAQASRDRASDAFRNDKSGAAVLITSDVSARGVDYPGVTRVIQVGPPSDREQYVHRVGRTGRAGMSGRGDFVLLPHEANYVRNVLGDVPLKPLSVADATAQAQELAQKHDADPAAFVRKAGVALEPTTRVGFARGRGRDEPFVARPARFAPQVAPKLEGMPAAVDDLKSRLDEEAVRETYLATLGFYVAILDDLRVSRRQLIDQFGQWTVDALGLPAPPHVSDAFLTKIGLNPKGGDPQYRDRRGPGGFGARTGGAPQVRSSYGVRRATSPSEREWDGGRAGAGFGDRRSGFGGDRGGYERRDRGGFGGGSGHRDRAPWEGRGNQHVRREREGY